VFPDDPALFEQHLWGNDRLLQYCPGCHSSESETPQQSHDAVKPKIDLYGAGKPCHSRNR